MSERNAPTNVADHLIPPVSRALFVDGCFSAGRPDGAGCQHAKQAAEMQDDTGGAGDMARQTTRASEGPLATARQARTGSPRADKDAGRRAADDRCAAIEPSDASAWEVRAKEALQIERQRHEALEAHWEQKGKELLLAVHAADAELIQREARLQEREQELERFEGWNRTPVRHSHRRRAVLAERERQLALQAEALNSEWRRLADIHEAAERRAPREAEAEHSWGRMEAAPISSVRSHATASTQTEPERRHSAAQTGPQAEEERCPNGLEAEAPGRTAALEPLDGGGSRPRAGQAHCPAAASGEVAASKLSSCATGSMCSCQVWNFTHCGRLAGAVVLPSLAIHVFWRILAIAAPQHSPWLHATSHPATATAPIFYEVASEMPAQDLALLPREVLSSFLRLGKRTRIGGRCGRAESCTRRTFQGGAPPGGELQEEREEPRTGFLPGTSEASASAPGPAPGPSSASWHESGEPSASSRGHCGAESSETSSARGAARSASVDAALTESGATLKEPTQELVQGAVSLRSALGAALAVLVFLGIG